MHGHHTLRTWSKDQTTYAMSSGEAELYAANLGGMQGLGLQSVAKDFGVEVKLNLFIAAKATVDIVNRRGLGKVRHLAVNDLWLQDAVKSKRIVMHKVASKDNMADLMTKPLAFEDIESHPAGLKLEWKET